MSDSNKKYDTAGEQPAEAPDKTPEIDPFASLNKILDENPAFKSTYDTVTRIMTGDSDPDELVEVEYLEIDGKEYVVIKEFEIAGTTYLFLANDQDIMDFMFQKIVVEEDEEYAVGLDSEEEFELAWTYFQRDFLMELKKKLKEGGKETPDGQ